MSESPAIEAHDLTRVFGAFTAVDHIDLLVPKGTIFGLLGANGAGKSTTIRMLCGLLRSSAGSASVAGHDIDSEPESIKRSIGYMSQEFSLYRDLTVAENIGFFGGVYGLSKGRIRERMDWVLAMAGLKGREDMLADELSGGWRQRLALGCAILHEPPIVFLDEPTGGVDPVSRRDFWELINNLADAGVTILVTTHYLDEAEYCTEISLMHDGRIVAQGSPAALKRAEIKFPMWQVTCPIATDAAAILGDTDWVTETSIFARNLHIGTLLSREEAPGRITKSLEDAGIGPFSVSEITPSLEDVFIHVIRQSSREVK